jgi:DNA-binding winged helix-turn-helix (wHTH) protein
MSTILKFGDCVFDLDRRELRLSGTPRHLTPKAVELLILLLKVRPRALTKREILAHVWPDAFVSDGSIAVIVAELRRAMGDDAREPRYLRTLHGFGVAFCAEAVYATEAQAAPAVCRLVAWGLHQFPLGAGTALIGRDLACDVRLDVGSVSRRHARLHIAPGMAVLEDLDSRNGCQVNGDAVTGSRPLAEGDDIRLGAVALSFHWVPASGPSQTSSFEVASVRNP